jgi:RNA recognition motif-containing protein
MCAIHANSQPSASSLTPPSVKPHDDPNVIGDPLKTLFVSRLSYNTEVKDLEREFGRYGAIERVRYHLVRFAQFNADNPRSAWSRTQPHPILKRSIVAMRSLSSKETLT